jgi:hypothetical protein
MTSKQHMGFGQQQSPFPKGKWPEIGNNRQQSSKSVRVLLTRWYRLPPTSGCALDSQKRLKLLTRAWLCDKED